MKHKYPVKHQLLTFLLLGSFLLTLLVPLTGIAVHKLASAVFLICCIIHTVQYRKQLNAKKYAVLTLVIVSFVSGIFGMIFDEIPLVLAMHKVVSIACVFFLAIHIFIWHKNICLKKKG